MRERDCPMPDLNLDLLAPTTKTEKFTRKSHKDNNTAPADNDSLPLQPESLQVSTVGPPIS